MLSSSYAICKNEAGANEVHEFVRLDQKKLEKLKAKPKKTKVDMANIANLEESLVFMQSEHTRLRKEWNKLTANAKLVYDDTRVMLREQYEMEQSELLREHVVVGLSGKCDSAVRMMTLNVAYQEAATRTNPRPVAERIR